MFGLKTEVVREAAVTGEVIAARVNTNINGLQRMRLTVPREPGIVTVFTVFVTVSYRSLFKPS
jgi:hypothetical protein